MLLLDPVPRRVLAALSAPSSPTAAGVARSLQLMLHKPNIAQQGYYAGAAAGGQVCVCAWAGGEGRRGGRGAPGGGAGLMQGGSCVCTRMERRGGKGAAAGGQVSVHGQQGREGGGQGDRYVCMGTRGGKGEGGAVR